MADTEVETAVYYADANIWMAFNDLKCRIKADLPSNAIFSFLLMINKTNSSAMTVKSTF